MENRQQTGRKGEDLACEYLISHGHSILKRNYRYGHLEIDIISLDKNGIHFVEVKTRRPPMQASPRECVGQGKQNRLVKAAMHFLNTKTDGKLADQECQFDIIAIIIGKTTSLEFIPRAFIPLYL